MSKINSIWFDADESRATFERQTNLRKERRILEIASRLAKMKMEGLALFASLVTAIAFHTSPSHMRILLGSNRAGKTVHAVAEFAAAMAGACLAGYKRYPKQGKAQVVGMDGDHLAAPMLSKLIDEGSFKIIRDEHTRLWRAVRPDVEHPTRLDPYDVAYQEKWRDAPPLLPPRCIREIAWEDVKKRIPRYVRTEGWESLWRSSKGKPSQGRDFDLLWIDEHIENDQFYYEGVRGLTDRHGQLVWSATPQNTNPVLMDLLMKANMGEENYHVTTLLIKDNPYLTDAAKQQFYDAIPEEERRVRWFGEPALLGRQVYSYQPQGIHGCEPRTIPPDWTHYAIVDPGGGGHASHVGCLHIAVDPKDKHVWVYDGYDMRGADAAKWANAMRQREPQYGYEAFVMDQQAGQQCPFATSKTVAQQYGAALENAGVVPHTKGPMYGFIRGSKDVAGRTEALRAWMNVRDSGVGAGTPRLQVFRGRLGKLDRQIANAQYDERGKRSKKYAEDVLVCLEYAAGYDPTYKHRVGRPASSRPDPILELALKKQRRTSPSRTF